MNQNIKFRSENLSPRSHPTNPLKSAAEIGRGSEWSQPKTKLQRKSNILTHRIHVYTFLVTFLISETFPNSLFSEIKELHIDSVRCLKNRLDANFENAELVPKITTTTSISL